MEKVFLEIELKHVMQLENMEKVEAEQSESVIGEESRIHATKRFLSNINSFNELTCT